MNLRLQVITGLIIISLLKVHIGWAACVARDLEKKISELTARKKRLEGNKSGNSEIQEEMRKLEQELDSALSQYWYSNMRQHK